MASSKSQLSRAELSRLEAAGIKYPWSARQLLELVDGGAQPFDKRAANRMAAAVDFMVNRRLLDARSPAADARLDYGDPFEPEEAERIWRCKS
jgi:hypothetical protein